ncbi:hypothetical protein EV207_13543 [Scopulibacillus darangshiensis]|uniref:DUF327 family protein n=1 Tax=Scopulibacillus darangshiensis TaxID=442528 RepID=A0A4R2NLW1_9BACL|nr:YaaR family protein [Scopulibacillus darangshiensis]TCP22567.1 hypothetical protein EV207_13543 [Scopulibacillus darangshiensis]
MAIKIQKERSIHESLAKTFSSDTKSATPFTNHIDKQNERLQADMLHKLLSKIDDQAKRLTVSKTIKDVQIYKKCIHEFIKEAVHHGLEAKQSRSWHRLSGPHQTIVKQLDEKLVALTNDVLNKESAPIDLLNKIGEIRGLLINLYI